MEEKEGPKIFIVDDDIFSLAIFKNHLANLGFHSIECFSTAEELLENLSQNPSLVLLDYCMGEDNGYDLLKKIKEYDPFINVMIVSGQSNMYVTVELLNNGAFDYVVKGEKVIQEITAAINKWMNLREYKNKVSDSSFDKDEVLRIILQSKEKVRKEISNELHDNINQLLATSKLYVETAIINEYDRMVLLEESKNYIDTAIGEIRKLSHSLNVSLLKEINLEEEIQKLIDTLSIQNQFYIYSNVSFKNQEKNIPVVIKHAVRRTVQEHFNNLLKHARARKVNFNLEICKEQLKLTIEDDGVGFDPEKIKRGLGLKNINERIAGVNGEIELKSTPGIGTSLNIVIPFAQLPNMN